MREQILDHLLAEEIAACEATGLLEDAGARLWRDGSYLYLSFQQGRDSRAGTFRLDCAGFDAHPISVAMVDAVTLAELPLEQWTPGVPHSIHPLTQKPFVCLQGIAEYHSHPSHTGDSWDRYRNLYRIPQLVKRLLEKAGALDQARSHH